VESWIRRILLLASAVMALGWSCGNVSAKDLKPALAYNTVQALEDPTGKLDVDAARAAWHAGKFSARSASFGFTPAAIWLRVEVANGEAAPVTWWFDIGNRTVNEADLYSFVSGAPLAHQSTGTNFPFEQRPLATNNFVFPVSVPAHGATELYLRVRSTGYPNVELHPGLWRAADFRELQLDEDLVWAGYLGVALALGILNLTLWIYLRDSAYLLYVLSLLSVVFAVSTVNGGYGAAYRDFWPDSPVFQQAAWALSTTVACIFPQLFVLHLLEVKRRIRRIFHIVSGLSVLSAAISLCLVLATFAQLKDAAAFLQGLAISGGVALHPMFIFMVYAMIKIARQGERIAKFLLVANSAFVVWIVVDISLVLIYGKEFSTSALIFASAFELIVMALALADRFNQERLQRMATKQTLIETLKASESELELRVLQRTQELNVEKERTKELLYNILPIELAEELATTGKAKPAKHDSATILFADFAGFTQIASAMPADRMVTELNEIFAAFDDIVDELGLEKIKTIGDAYMAAAGLPKPCADHAQRCVRAGLRMIDYTETRNATNTFKWSLRVGIHSGPVVSGVVGKRKYAFDIWGDTVNIAARMESASEPGRVNLSAYTTDLAKSDFACEYRGKLEVKGKGRVDMYFATGEQVAP